MGPGVEAVGPEPCQEANSDDGKLTQDPFHERVGLQATYQRGAALDPRDHGRRAELQWGELVKVCADCCENGLVHRRLLRALALAA